TERTGYAGTERAGFHQSADPNTTRSSAEQSGASRSETARLSANIAGAARNDPGNRRAAERDESHGRFAAASPSSTGNTENERIRSRSLKWDSGYENARSFAQISTRQQSASYGCA